MRIAEHKIDRLRTQQIGSLLNIAGEMASECPLMQPVRQGLCTTQIWSDQENVSPRERHLWPPTTVKTTVRKRPLDIVFSPDIVLSPLLSACITVPSRLTPAKTPLARE